MGDADTPGAVGNGAPPGADDAPSAPEMPPELSRALAEAQEHREAMLRARADLENARRRHERELQNATRYGAEGLVLDLLPVRDSLEEALRASTQSDQSDAGLGRFIEGTRLTLTLLEKALERAGVKEVPAQGRFDPALHQAMAMQESGEVEDGHILAVAQKGFLLSDRLIRPAMVIVAKAPGAP
jgi:molecular chaperone GrpE